VDRDAVILSAARTPIGRFGGSLASVGAAELGRVAAVAAVERAGLAPEDVDQTVFGHARQAGQGPNGARQVSVRAGIPVERPAFAINQACLSGMQAVLTAARMIRSGESRVVLAGGMEAMSQVPYLLPQARWGHRMGHAEVVDAMVRDGYLDPLCDRLMGATAETLAERYGISREEQDAYAVETQHRCQRARETGRFDAELVPLDVAGRRETVRVGRDEHPRDDVTVEQLAKLPPAFRKGGTVTAGNASGITDGAAALIVASSAFAHERGVRPLARIVDWTVSGVAPEVMGLGPVPAVRELERRTGVAPGDCDLVELNEAFAAQVLAVDRELGFDRTRLNVNGGAIALGHPSGCSGARIVVTLLHELIRREGRRGLATLCVSGGMGGALLIERTI
jgi:acetyl-CoA C-acetyltransferase